MVHRRSSAERPRQTKSSLAASIDSLTSLLSLWELGGQGKRKPERRNDAANRWHADFVVGEFRQTHLSVPTLAISTLIGIVLVWHIATDYLGLQFGQNNPALALSWNSSEVTALNASALRMLSDKKDGELARARGLAERALLVSPLDPRSLLLLGIAAERSGNKTQAGRLIDLSGRVSRRDWLAQIWLFHRDTAADRFDEALNRLDAMARLDTVAVDDFAPLYAAFTIDDAAFAALVAQLKRGDVYRRADILERLSTQLASVDRLVQLFTALQSTLHSSDYAAYLGRLVLAGRIGEAHAIWRQVLGDRAGSTEVNLYNGNFVLPIDGMPFNWLLRPAVGTDMQIVGAPEGGEGRALRLQFTGARAGVFVAEQLLALPQGKWRMRGQMRADDFEAERGLAWRVACHERPEMSLGMGPLISRSAATQTFEFTFVVPPDCAGQWLRLEIPSRTDSERRIEGQIWYRALTIEPAGE